MINIDNGGPAFPTTWLNEGDTNATAPDGQLVPPGWTVQLSGMTLRDYFATHTDMFIEDDGCIPQRLAIAVMDGGNPPDWYDEPVKAMQWWFEAEARYRYMKADAMLRARGAA